MATGAQNAVKQKIRDAEWTFPKRRPLNASDVAFVRMLLHSGCVSCKTKGSMPLPVSSPQSRWHWHLPSHCLISLGRIFCILNPLMKKGGESP